MCRCTFPCGGRGWFSSVARSVRPPRSRRPPPLSLSLSLSLPTPHPRPPTKPTPQLAWFGAAFWVVVFGVAFGGGKKKTAAADAPAVAAAKA
jgi:hypothetical protein